MKETLFTIWDPTPGVGWPREAYQFLPRNLDASWHQIIVRWAMEIIDAQMVWQGVPLENRRGIYEDYKKTKEYKRLTEFLKWRYEHEDFSTRKRRSYIILW